MILRARGFQGGDSCGSREGSVHPRLEGSEECYRGEEFLGVGWLLLEVYQGLREDISPINSLDKEESSLHMGRRL